MTGIPSCTAYRGVLPSSSRAVATNASPSWVSVEPVTGQRRISRSWGVMWAMGPVYGFSVVHAEYVEALVRCPCPPAGPGVLVRCEPRWNSSDRFRVRRGSPGDPSPVGGVRTPRRPRRRVHRKPHGVLREVPGAGPASHAARSVGGRARYISRNSAVRGRWPVARERRWNRRTQTSGSRWPSGHRRSVNKVEGIPRENSLPAVPSATPQAAGHGGKRFPAHVEDLR